MVNDANGKWIGFGVGDTDPAGAKPTDPNYHAVSLINQKLYDRFTSTHALGQTRDKAIYDDVTAQAVALIAHNYGMTVPVDPQGNAVANLAFRTKIGAYPPPPPPTHAMFTVRGTGGIIGQDYTSLIAQALPGIYHEHPIDYAASMGGIPVGAATDPNAPSGDECADQAEQLLTDAVNGSTVSFAIAAYSLGAFGAIQFINKLFDPTQPLYAHKDRLVCAVMLGDPWRPFGHTFYLGPIPNGQGIGAPYFTWSDAAIAALGWRCCWLANPTDMYTNSPLGATGQVLADVEQIVLETAISDPLGSIQRAIPYLLQLVEKDGGLASIFTGNTGSLLSSIAGGQLALTGGLVGLLLPVLEAGFTGLIDGISGNGANLPPGIAADVQAAILALKFYGGGIQGHVTYHSTPWSPNSPQTYLELGIQHAADWGSRVPVLT